MTTIKAGPNVTTVAAPVPLIIEGGTAAAVVIPPPAAPLGIGFSPNLTALNETLSTSQNAIELQQRTSEDKQVLAERVESLITTFVQTRRKSCRATVCA